MTGARTPEPEALSGGAKAAHLGRPRCGSRDGWDPLPSLRKDGRPRKRNRYPARCFFCGESLTPGAGVIEWSPDEKRWTAFCTMPGPSPYPVPAP